MYGENAFSMMFSKHCISAPGPVCELYNGSKCHGYGSIGMDYIFINTSLGKQADYETEIIKVSFVDLLFTTLLVCSFSFSD